MRYTLQSGGCAAQVETLGGELVSWRDGDGAEYVWGGDPAYWSGHAPVLFPIVGALKGETTAFNGFPYRIKKHGFARRMEFRLELLEQDRAAFVLESSPETFQSFPFHFRLRVVHTVSGQGFETAYQVENLGQETLFFCLGGHAGFRCPLGEGEAFEDYRLTFEKTEQTGFLCTDAEGILSRDDRLTPDWDGRELPLGYEIFDRDVLVLEQVRSRAVQMQKGPGGPGLEFRFHGFSSLGLWTPPHKKAPFLCLEPWQGLPAFADESGAFETKPGVIRLQQSGVYSAGYSMRIKK